MINREAGWVALGNSAVAIGNILFIKTITIIYPSPEIGLYALVLTIATIANQVITGGILAALTRYVVLFYEDGFLGDFLNTGASLILRVITALFLLDSGVLVALYLIGYKSYIPSVAAVGLLSCLQFLSSAIGSIYYGLRMRSVVAIAQIVDQSVRILALYALSSAASPSAVYIILACCTSSLAAIYYQLSKLKGDLNISEIHLRRSNPLTYSNLVRFAFPISIWGIFSAGYQISDKYSLKYFGGLESVAELSVLYQIGYTPVSAFANLMISYISPIIFHMKGANKNLTDNKEPHRYASRMFIAGIGSTFLLSLPLFVFSEEIILLLASDEYVAVSYLLPYVFISAGVYASTQVIAINSLSNFEPDSILAPKAWSSVIGIIMNILAAYYYGIAGVVWASLFYSIVHLLLIASVMNKRRWI